MNIIKVRDVLDRLFQKGHTIYVTREKYEQIQTCLRVVDTVQEADWLNRDITSDKTLEE